MPTLLSRNLGRQFGRETLLWRNNNRDKTEEKWWSTAGRPWNREAAPFRNDAEFPVVENNEISTKYKNEDGVRNDDNFVPGAAAEWLPCLAPAELPVYRRGDVVGCATRDRVAELAVRTTARRSST